MRYAAGSAAQPRAISSSWLSFSVAAVINSFPTPSRNNCRLDLARSVHQLLKHAIELVEMRMAGDERARLEPSARDQIQRLAADGRCVMKRSPQRDVAIVNAIRVQHHMRIRGA